MWLILLWSSWSSSFAWGITWYPPAPNSMLGEQTDLVGDGNATYRSNWMRNTANNGVNDAGDTVVSMDSIDSMHSPINTVDREREPLDEVERIEPRQWPRRPDILPTRSTVPFTTETSLPRRIPQTAILSQKNSSTQRFYSIL